MLNSILTKLPHPSLTLFTLACTVMAGCSSGGGGSPKSTSSRSSSSVSATWQAGVYAPSLELYQRCAIPRTGNDPYDGQPYIDVQGTAMDEKLWIRSMSNEFYLWYDLLPDPNPANYGILNYFDTMKISSDRFHFSMDYEEYFTSFETGVSVDYGVQWAIESSEEPPFRVADVEVSSGYSDQIKRGDILLTIDGIDATTITNLVANYYRLIPDEAGEMHTITLADRDTGETKMVTLTAAEVTYDPVPRHKVIDTDSGKVGYIQFNDHNNVAEGKLIDAVTELRDTGITDLVLDLRYNLGGVLSVASQLAYMIAGDNNTDGKIFEALTFSDKYPETNPFTGAPLETIPFIDTSDLSGSSMALPSLNLSRLYVLTSEDTCSASESIMNGLSGAGVEVIQIGDTTCGKPYGFYPLENCGTLYFTVMFKGRNHMGFGDYDRGFTPERIAQDENGQELVLTANGEDVFNGCAAYDDLTQDLGEVDERLLALALQYRANQTCELPAQAVESSAMASPRLHKAGTGSATELDFKPYQRPGKVILDNLRKH